MPEITPRLTPSFTGIQLAADDSRIGLWGRSHGGNLSLNNRAVMRDAALKAAFDGLGAEVWTRPGSTPHGGNNYYKTKTGISWEETVHFLAGCGYTMGELGGDPLIDPPAPVDANLLPVSLSRLCAAAGDFDRVRGVFSDANRLHRYRPGGNQSWPAGRGVYVIWKLDPSGDTIVYIGKVGEFKRDANGVVRFGGGTLAQRFSRWHPYSFTTTGPFANHFEYGPNESVNELRNLPEAGRYKFHLHFDVIAVDCYVTDGIEREISPSFLEVMLLQMYMAQHGALPPANNAL
jgi:hypothetical protein